MRKLSLCIPLDYVATRVDLVVMVCGCLLMLGLGLMMWNALVEVPAVPEKLVLRSAYVTHPLDWSKSSAYLYFNVERDEGDYKYRVVFFNNEARLLEIHKNKKLWVAVDANSDNQFVWAVYDGDLRLMMGRQQIQRWLRHKNGGSYLAIVLSCLAFSCCAFFMVRCHVWNRYYCRGVVDDSGGS